ncbi:MAG: site-specific integrase [Oscillospiraceae bacterium]|nr:site-specific integrase [Oscillospiraceae bacterium]
MAKTRASGEGSIRKRADGRWEARYYDPREPDPKKQRKSIINKSQKFVIDRLRTVQAEINGGETMLVKNNPTVAEWLELWMNEYKLAELRDTTFETYRSNISISINPIIGEIKLKKLTGLNIQMMYNRLQLPKDKGGRNLSAASIIKIKNILSGALQQAKISSLIRNNPLLETNSPKVEDKAMRIMTKSEQKQFISVLPFYHTGNMFAVALATGMRIGELCALDVNDINRELKYIDITKTAGRRKDKNTGEVSIKIGPPKTKNSVRKVPLLPSVEVMFDRQAQLVSEMRTRAGEKWKENTLVFPTDMGNIHDLSGLRSSIGRVLNRAGLPHMPIHALRHTYATTALNAGVAAQNVARLLGHKDGATTLRLYAHYINIEATTQLEKLEHQNISHLGITAVELERIIMGTSEAIEKSSITERIDDAIRRAKSFPQKKSVEMVLSVCEDILCQPMDDLTVSDKDVFLGVLAQYTIMKRQGAVQENAGKPKGKGAR